MSELILPSSVEAERSILGAVLLNNNLTSELAGLNVDDFSLDSHRKVFTRMCDLYIGRSAIDIITLSEILSANGELQSVGGVSYISSLTDGVPVRASVSHYVRIVREKALLRQLVHLCSGLSAQASSGNVTADEIIQKAQDACLNLSLQSAEGEKDIFVDAADFCHGEDSKPDWLVEGLIERGSNGVVVADPKGAKSLTFGANLSVCLAMGQPFMGLEVKGREKGRTRVALVSREDNPSTTKRRIKQIVRGKGGNTEELRNFLYVNSKQQTPSLMLDNPREVNSLIRSLKLHQSEFVILDVFNKMHVQDENDNTKVRAVMNQVDRIASETGAMVCILHHFNKGDASQSITRRIRGAGAIAGFAEWIAGIEMVDESQQVRKMSFETKVGEYLAPITYRVVDEHGGMKFQVMLSQPIGEQPATTTKYPRGRNVQ